MSGERDWHVLLVGGPSATGKSTACAELMRRYGVGAGEIDDLVAAVQAMTTPEQQPILHYWSTQAESREWTAEELVEVTIASAGAIEPAVEAVVECHLDNGPPIVMEGDYLLPAFAARIRSARVKVVFVYEPDEAQLVANYLSREAEPQHLRAEVGRLFGERLAAQALELGVPVVAARPWDTLPDRIVDALS